MRSRPDVKLLIRPSHVTPGVSLEASVILTARTETPVDFVALHLHGVLKATVTPQTDNAETPEQRVLDLQSRSKALMMQPGEHRYDATFDLPPYLPLSYVGELLSIVYSLSVRVSIPWWPDREADFPVWIESLPVPAPEPLPNVFFTAVGDPYAPGSSAPGLMELALDATQIAVGERLCGSISLHNLDGRRVRGIDLMFVEVETIRPSGYAHEARRFTVRVLDRAPLEGEPIPFRVTYPERATPTFDTGALRVETYAEVRAKVAWGEDIILRAPLLITPRAIAPRPESEWVAIGRKPPAIVWQEVAAAAGLVADPHEQRMSGRHRDVAIEITAEQREDGPWLVAKLGWAKLGLDLEISERRWSDALALGVARSGDDAVDARFSAYAREHAQARALLTPLVMRELLVFEDVRLHDTGGKLGRRGSPFVPHALEQFLAQVKVASEVLARAIGQISPPALHTNDVPAWQALAARLRGRLELGRMWIHDAQVGTSAVAIGSVWARGGLHLGTTVRVSIDPPLATVPTGIEAPSLSPAARATWRELITCCKSVRIDSAAITIELEGRLADPQVAMPVVELGVRLRQALAGHAGAGPFR